MGSRFAAAIQALESAVRQSVGFRTWLRGRRWCGEAVGPRSALVVQDAALLAETGTEALVFLLAHSREGASSVLLHLPLSLATARFSPGAFELSVGHERFYVMEAERRESYVRFLLEAFHSGPAIRPRTGGAFRFRGGRLGAYRGLDESAPGDSSNLVLRIATTEASVVFKSYKRMDPQNREPVILERLRRRRFPHVPRLLGEVSLDRNEDRWVLGIVTEHIASVDLFTWLVDGWRASVGVDSPQSEAFEAAMHPLATHLGAATAALHDALVDRKAGYFQAETFTADDAQASYRLATRNLADAVRLLAHRDVRNPGIPPARAAESRGLLLDHRRDIENVLASLQAGVGTVKSVTHADLHLGQVLRSTRDGGLTFIDFEGEPDRPPGARSVKLPPLRDVATMIRSFAYVRHMVLPALAEPASEEVVADTRRAGARLQAWEEATVRAFRGEYLARTRLYPEFEPDTAERFVRGWTMEKALYELRYELKHRPANFAIPLDGVLALAGAGA